MEDERDRKYSTDESGNTWLIDKSGEFVTDGRGGRIPGPARAIPDPISGFTTYDSSRGHCGLCGSLTCRGSCFK